MCVCEFVCACTAISTNQSKVSHNQTKINQTQRHVTQQNKNHPPKYTFSRSTTAPCVPGLPYYRGVAIQSDAPHSAGVLWKSDQPDAETSTWQHTSMTTGKIRTRNPSMRAQQNGWPLGSTPKYNTEG